MISPPRLRDMSPIEHVWVIIDRTVREQNLLPATLLQFWAAVQIAWLNISSRDFQWHVDLITCGVSALRRTKVGPT